MLFKRSFGLTRSLFILHVHEHDRLGFGMLTVETAVIAFFAVDLTEKVSRIRSNIIWNPWKSTLRARSIWMREPESEKGNVNTAYFVNQARENTRISRTAKFGYDK